MLYQGILNIARKVSKLYIGVGNKARKVKKVYIGVNGRARLVYPIESGTYQWKVYNIATQTTYNWSKYTLLTTYYWKKYVAYVKYECTAKSPSAPATPAIGDTYETGDGRNPSYLFPGTTWTKIGATPYYPGGYEYVSSPNQWAYPNGLSSDNQFYYISDGGVEDRGTYLSSVSSTSRTAYPDAGSSGGYYYVYDNSASSQIKGSDTGNCVYSDNRNQYPDDGIQGNYWYTFVE